MLEFELTSGGKILGTTFKKIEELIIPYFKKIEMISFHDDDYGNVTLENKDWDIYIYIYKDLIINIEEDYLLSIGYKGTFTEGEKALKAFAEYLSKQGFIYSLEYEDNNENEYIIEHPNLSNFYEEREKKSYPEYQERLLKREQASKRLDAWNNRTFWQKTKDWFNEIRGKPTSIEKR